MTITIKRSTDGGAPSLTNVAGTIIGVLDPMMTAISWTKTSLGTNQAKYAQPGGTNGFALQVDDTNAAYARALGFETLTALNTGTNQFPSAAQLSGGVYIDHASTGSAVPWRCVSNGKIVYLFLKYNTSSGYWSCFAFGDFVSYKSGDTFGTCIIGNELNGSSANPRFAQLNGSGFSGTQPGHFMARTYTQFGASVTAGKFSDTARLAGATAMGQSGMTYPSPVEGGLHLAPVWLNETITGLGARGLLPGIWAVCHSRPLNDGDTFTISSGALAGRSFEIVDLGSALGGQFAFETSDTWGGF